MYKRWKLILNLITEDNGGNQLVEAKHGKLYREPSPEVKDPDKETARHTPDDNNLTPEDIDHRDQGLD